MRMECVVCPASLSHFPPNAAVGSPAPPECVLCTMLLRSVMHIPTLLLQVVGVVQMLQWQCCSQLSVRHIPSLVCSAAHDASIMLRKEGGVINTHLLPARCDEGSMRRGEIYIIRKNMNKGDRGAKWS